MTEQLAFPGTEKRSRYRPPHISLMTLDRPIKRETLKVWNAARALRRQDRDVGILHTVYRIGHNTHSYDGRTITTKQLMKLARALYE